MEEVMKQTENIGLAEVLKEALEKWRKDCEEWKKFESDFEDEE
jgi:DNA-directed RNA polymerase subunit L